MKRNTLICLLAAALAFVVAPVAKANGTVWVSAPLFAPQTKLVGRAVISTDITIPSSGVLGEWAHLVSATTVFNTATQMLADTVTWTSTASGVLSVLATPTVSTPPVFEVTGTQSGDQVIIRLECADLGGHQDEAMTLSYAFASSAPTWPGGYTFPNTSSILRGSVVGATFGQVEGSVYVGSAPSGTNLFIQPAVVNLITSSSGQTTEFGGSTNLVVEVWRQ